MLEEKKLFSIRRKMITLFCFSTITCLVLVKYSGLQAATITINNPTDKQKITLQDNPNNITVNGIITDGDGKIKWEIAFNGTTYPTATPVYTSSDSNGSVNVSPATWPTTNSPFGLKNDAVTATYDPRPTVTSTSPTDDATALPTLTTVSATMNENMKQSLNTGSYGISGGGGNATISFDPGWISSSTVRFSIHDPAAEEGNNLKCGATYTVTISGFQDLAGNTLNSYSWHFHTSCPSVKEITPKDTLSLANPVFVVKFSDPVAPMDKESTQTAFSINSNDVKLEFLSWEDDYTIKLKAVNLKPNTTYTITIDGKKAKNTKGETLIGGDYKWEVRTGEK